jgi:patatin-like phospholipase/acyl hydrolase
MASSAAPTIFKSYRNENSILCIDGGIGANNPTFLGVAEAIGVLEWSIETLKVLSLGCTEEIIKGNDSEGTFFRGKLYYANHITDMFMKAQSGYSDGLTRILLRVEENEDRYVRINQYVSPKDYDLDKADTSTIKNLKGLASSKERENLNKIKIFFQEKAERFKPVYKINE